MVNGVTGNYHGSTPCRTTWAKTSGFATANLAQATRFTASLILALKEEGFATLTVLARLLISITNRDLLVGRHAPVLSQDDF